MSPPQHQGTLATRTTNFGALLLYVSIYIYIGSGFGFRF